MRRILMVLAVALVMVALLGSAAMPALAVQPVIEAGPCTTKSGKPGESLVRIKGSPNASKCHPEHT